MTSIFIFFLKYICKLNITHIYAFGGGGGGGIGGGGGGRKTKVRQ